MKKFIISASFFLVSVLFFSVANPYQASADRASGDTSDRVTPTDDRETDDTADPRATESEIFEDTAPRDTTSSTGSNTDAGSLLVTDAVSTSSTLRVVATSTPLRGATSTSSTLRVVATSTPLRGATSTSSTLRVVQPLQDVVVEVPKEIPKGFFWKKFGQKLVLFFTFDAIKDAQKKLEYAEENMLLAEFIIENTDNKSDQELAAELIDTANQYVQSITEKTQQLLDEGKGSEEVKILFENLAIHTQNKQLLLENIKDLVDLSQVQQLEIVLQNANQLDTNTAGTLLNAGNALGLQSIIGAQVVIPDAVLEYLKTDQDGDGLLDTKEDELGTSKFDFDTDHDGISDAQEVDLTGTSPIKADTDGDGFWDGYELLKGYSPVGALKLDKFPTKVIGDIDVTTGLIKDLQPNQFAPTKLNQPGAINMPGPIGGLGQ